MRVLPSLLLVGLGACASQAPVPVTAPPSEPVSAAPAPVAPAPLPAADPVSRGEAPWWEGVSTGIYALSMHPGGTTHPWAVAVGRSSEHHHAVQGLIQAKVEARMVLGELAASGLELAHEPGMIDLFVTAEGELLVLYGSPVLEAPDDIEPLHPPARLDSPRRQLVGRHAFEHSRHLYLECEVEGPLANPEWGTSRLSAQLHLQENP